MPERPEPHSVRRLLEALGVGAKKRWGQNFLSNPDTARRIVELGDLGSGDIVWEIGPGLGILTERLLAAGAEVVAFEIDWGLVAYLRERFSGTRLTVVPGDAVKELPNALDAHGAPSRLISNLPYRSAATILGRLVEGAVWIPLQVVTVQREVAERMLAAPGTKDYSSFTVLMQSGYEIRREMQLPPGVFYPVPEVDSTVLRLRLKAGPPDDPEALSRLCRAAFAARRKTIKNNLLSAPFGDGRGRQEVLDALEELRISPEVRAERLSVEQMIALARRLGGALSGPGSP
ncbi:MAG: 16S rRNA (adenine(1518)-N(6)/adenine(1519)-N(6))-dimethyltransferase RsmA [Spirochaetota bacterium]